jgi:hypothetical protein
MISPAVEGLSSMNGSLAQENCPAELVNVFVVFG